MHDLNDYEQKYPPDEEYQEMAPSARVYKTYVDEAEKHDTELVEGWRDSLDMLLLFVSAYTLREDWY